MQCPRCRKNEFSPDGICLACNYKIIHTESDTSLAPRDNAPEPQNSSPSPGGSAASVSSDEIPPWQKALAQRLEALKDEKQTDPSPGEPIENRELPKPLTAKWNLPEKEPEIASGQADSGREPKRQTEAKASASVHQRTAPQQKTIASLGEKVLHAPERTVSTNIRDLIDSAVSRKAAPSAADASPYSSGRPVERENKFILLSRTLSGLIDMIFVILCTGAFIIAADSVSGIVTLDGASIIEYAILFLLIFFLYSVFFLGASGQTIGMMITDLRIVGIEGSRPSIGQLFIRCFGYLLSLTLLGAGLIWSFFDRNNRCFHDRFSDTSVIRL